MILIGSEDSFFGNHGTVLGMLSWYYLCCSGFLREIKEEKEEIKGSTNIQEPV